MVQLRRNHSSNNKGLVTTFRLIIFLIIAVIALVGSFIYYKKTFLNSSTYIQEIDYSDRTFLPSATGEIVFHKYYTLSYVEKYELAEWTAYMLNKDLLNKPNVDRFQNFIPDYNVSTRSSFTVIMLTLVLTGVILYLQGIWLLILLLCVNLSI